MGYVCECVVYAFSDPAVCDIILFFTTYMRACYFYGVILNYVFGLILCVFVFLFYYSRTHMLDLI